MCKGRIVTPSPAFAVTTRAGQVHRARRRARSRARRRRAVLTVLTAGLAAAAIDAPAVAAPTELPADSDLSAAVVVENWRGYSGPFRKTHKENRIIVVSARGATDGKALKLQLDANPGTGPRQGVEIASTNPAFRYGTFGSRMKTANCAGQKRVGVVTGMFTYSMDHGDADGNGLPDNHEVDIEVLCAQPEVVWMSLWTDYDEVTDSPRKISRAVNLRTGQVLYNCYLTSWTGSCERLLSGENDPASVTPIPGFNSAAQFHSYSFNWQSNRVRFYISGPSGQPILLWDYQGPSIRIPQKTSMFLQNVWHTATWDPLNGPARERPTASTSAYLDSTTVPRGRDSGNPLTGD